VVAERRGRQREAGARDLPQRAVRSSFMALVILTKDLKGLSFFVVSFFSVGFQHTTAAWRFRGCACGGLDGWA